MSNTSYATLVETVRIAADAGENIENGSINWSFVDADAYAECRSLFSTDEMFYEAFDEICGVIISERKEEAAAETQIDMEFDLLARYPNAVEQLEVLKTDFLGM